ncbi:TonB-dependent receptor [Primorskyibacter flagellatus]|uniref:TonB-dependent receptor n=1 Tax=Primorskyibacter flagellatus TaxID=1387277 RepID=A0A917AA98_9RHOB|nr:TonB-dependent receptor [Primorskyibacter flagellatus]GGE37866.1 TonB-dependent receptor [Primorskyibacter flagellatus]
MTFTTRALLLTGAAICTGWGAAPVLAQEAVELDTIRVESDAAQDVLGNTQISEEEIEERNAQTIADVFDGQTKITASGGAPIAQKVFVHGIEESLLNVTIDGARQNKSAFHHVGNVLIDPSLLKQVDITSGLAPADQGPGALAGSIAYETKDARDLLEPGDAFGGQATLSYGSNAETFRRSLTVYGMQGGFEYLLSGTKSTGDAYKDGSGATVPYTGAGLTNYVAKVAYTSDTGKRLEFSVDHTEDSGPRAGQPRGGLVYIRPDFNNVGGTVIPVQAVSTRRSYAFTYTDEAPDGIWAPTIQLAYNEQELDGAQVTKGLNTSLSGTVKNDFTIGGGVLTAGLDFFHDTAENTGAPAAGTGAKETIDNIGVFAQMRQDVGARVSLSYGVRADFQRFHTADGQSFDSSGISVNAAADVVLTDRLTLNIGVASVWGGYELSEASLINTTSGAAVVSPWVYSNIKPSRANNARIGLRYDSGPWTASGALFYTEVKDAPYLFNASRTDGTSPYPTIVTKGVDASLRYTTATGYVQANYTYADVTLNGSQISSTSYYWGRPMGHLFGLSAAFEVAPGVMLGGSAEIALKNDKGTTTLPGYEVVNVFATYTPRQFNNLEVRLDVRNVFDETYSRRSSDGIDFGAVTPLTEPGRTIALTVNTKF